MNRTRIKIGNATRGRRRLPALVLTLTGTTLTWSPRDPKAVGWITNVYDLSGKLLADDGFIDGYQTSVNVGDTWDPPPFQVSIQAQGGDGINFGPESNKITWRG